MPPAVHTTTHLLKGLGTTQCCAGLATRVAKLAHDRPGRAPMRLSARSFALLSAHCRWPVGAAAVILGALSITDCCLAHPDRNRKGLGTAAGAQGRPEVGRRQGELQAAFAWSMGEGLLVASGTSCEAVLGMLTPARRCHQVCQQKVPLTLPSSFVSHHATVTYSPCVYRAGVRPCNCTLGRNLQIP